MIKPGMTIVEVIAQLTRGFIKMTGRNPDGLEKIKIKQEAVQKLKDLEKVVDMEGNFLDSSKPIMGGTQVGMFDNIFNKMQKQMGKGDPKIVKPDPEKKSMGGRIGLKDGPDKPSRRNFMKILGGLATIPIFGKFFRQADKVAPAAEKVAEVAGQTPSYFFDLVAKIKLLGEPRRTPSYKERVNEYQYTGKDGIEYELIEDLDTGEITIQKDKIGGRNYGDESYEVIEDRTELRYKKPKPDEGDPNPAEEYEEFKVEFDSDGTAADATEIDEISKMEIMKEITDEAPSIKKAGGGLAYMLGE